MSDLPAAQTPRLFDGVSRWQNQVVASTRFQKWAARFPFTRRKVRREGEALFDLVAGFCHSQILMAFVSLELPKLLFKAPASVAGLALKTGVPPERMTILMRAASALNLVKLRRDGRYRLTQRGAALAGVPGLADMIRHHDTLYRDLADPVAFFRGEVETELAGFWPYVFGAAGEVAPEVASRYSDLMSQSQSLVADDTLEAIDLSGAHEVMDVGGGTGAFLAAVGGMYPKLKLRLFDLPEVSPQAERRFASEGLTDRSKILSGSFMDEALPEGADVITLIRVLYDHSDTTVLNLLRKCHAALPADGRLIISEPMSGGAQPNRAGDAYFALYTLAMRTGKTRSMEEIALLAADAGFELRKMHRSRRPFITSCVEFHRS